MRFRHGLSFLCLAALLTAACGPVRARSNNNGRGGDDDDAANDDDATANDDDATANDDDSVEPGVWGGTAVGELVGGGTPPLACSGVSLFDVGSAVEGDVSCGIGDLVECAFQLPMVPADSGVWVPGDASISGQCYQNGELVLEVEQIEGSFFLGAGQLQGTFWFSLDGGDDSYVDFNASPQG